MRFLLLFLSLSSLAKCSEESNAINKSFEAVLAYPELKGAVDYNKKRFIKKSEVDERIWTNLAVFAYMTQTKKISTERIGNIRIDLEKGYIRPDFYYDTNTKDSGGTLKYKWSFE